MKWCKNMQQYLAISIPQQQKPQWTWPDLPNKSDNEGLPLEDQCLMQQMASQPTAGTGTRGWCAGEMLELWARHLKLMKPWTWPVAGWRKWTPGTVDTVDVDGQYFPNTQLHNIIWYLKNDSGSGQKMVQFCPAYMHVCPQVESISFNRKKGLLKSSAVLYINSFRKPQGNKRSAWLFPYSTLETWSIQSSLVQDIAALPRILPPRAPVELIQAVWLPDFQSQRHRRQSWGLKSKTLRARFGLNFEIQFETPWYTLEKNSSTGPMCSFQYSGTCNSIPKSSVLTLKDPLEGVANLGEGSGKRWKRSFIWSDGAPINSICRSSSWL